MKLEQLIQIAAVEKYHSVSEAARQLYISQPALSTSISNLEAELNVQIFKRGAKGTVPTPQGLEVLQLAREALDAIKRMQQVGSPAGAVSGDVYLLLSSAYSFIVPELMKRFRADYPQADLIIEEHDKMSVVEAIIKGLNNLGLIAWGLTPEEKPAYLKERNLEFELYGRREIVVYISKAHPFAQYNEVPWAEIIKEQLVLPSKRLKTLLASYQLTLPEKVLVMSDREALKKMVAENFAVAVMPDNYMIGDIFVELGLIQTVKIQGLGCCGMDCLLSSRRRRLSFLENQLLVLLRELLQGYEKECLAEQAAIEF